MTVTKQTMGPSGTPEVRSYVAEGAITRGMAVIPGTAENQVAPPGTVSTGNLKVVGIAMEDAADGGLLPVCVHGECIAIADDAITHGAILATVATSGKVITTTTDNDGVFARAVSDAVADGDPVTVFVMGPSRY